MKSIRMGSVSGRMHSGDLVQVIISLVKVDIKITKKFKYC